MTDQLYYQLRFTKEKDGKSYSDAITLPKADYEKLTPAEKETTKQQRFDNWIAILNAPPIEAPLEDQLKGINDQIAELTNQKLAIESQIVLKPKVVEK